MNQQGHQSTLNDFGVCTKYNKCMHANTNTRQPPQTGLDDSDMSQFSFPDHILADERPINIQMQPMLQPQNDDTLINRIVQNNINKVKLQQIAKKHEQEQKQKLRKQKLQLLRTECSNIMNKCPKKQLSLEKRNQWNHSIFGEKNIAPSNQKSNNEAEPVNTSPKKDKTVKLRQVNVRIEEYKENCRTKIEQQRKAQACQHKHIHPTKDVEQKKAEIEKRAEQLTKKMKEQKHQQEQNKKVIKAKIRAIQIQSRASLKKFKKKPVDPSIEFVVDVVPANQQKKTFNKQQIESNTAKIEALMKQQDQLRKASSQKRKAPKGQNKNKANGKQQGKSQPSVSESDSKQSLNQQQKQERPYEKKFYFWDMSIYQEDCQKIDLNIGKDIPKVNNPEKQKSFRSEVQEYLQQKMRNKMDEQNRLAKARKFEELVTEKKQVFLQQFERTHSLKESESEVYWNQDEMFKMQPISNFRN